MCSSDLHGNAVLQHAYRTEMQRVKQQKIALFDMHFDNAMTLLETAAQENPDAFPEYGDAFRANVVNQAMLLGDAGIQKEYSAKIKPSMDKAQINAVVKSLLTDEQMADYRGTIAKLRTGDVGKYSGMVKRLMTTDFETYQKIEARFTELVKQRKDGIDLALVDSVEQGKDIQRRIYASTNPKEQRQLYDQLKSLPVDPNVIKIGRAHV